MDKASGQGLGKVGDFWFVLLSCVLFGFLILVIRRFCILNIGKTTSLPLRLQGCPIQTPKWQRCADCFGPKQDFPVFFFFVGHVDSARAASLRRRRSAVGAANSVSCQTATAPSSPQVLLFIRQCRRAEGALERVSRKPARAHRGRDVMA